MADTVAETASQPDVVDGCVSSKSEPEQDDKVAENGHSSKEAQNGNEKESEENPEVEPELYFTPKVNLPIVIVKTMEDDEEALVELRARIYRYDTSEDEPEFKERGTGSVKILHHNKTNMFRILMRRDKTLKICANHHITSTMELNKHNNSDKVFVYSTLADLYEGEISQETFAIRFASPENATIFKNAFDEAVQEIKKTEKEQKKIDDVAKLTQELQKVDIEPKDNESKSEE